MPDGYHINVLVLNIELAFDLGSCLRWGKATVSWLWQVTDAFQL